MTQIVRAAIAAHADYFVECCEQRADAPSRAGSYFPELDPAGVARLVKSLHWEAYAHPAVMVPAVAYIARGTWGRLGMTHISDVPEDADLEWRDPKGTGFVEAVWTDAPEGSGADVDFVVAIVGPGPELWTFHPGDPVRPSQVERHRRLAGRPTSEDRHGHAVSKGMAEQLSVEWVKVGRREVQP